MKAVVAAFNQEKALVGAFSVITNLRMELFEALLGTLSTATGRGLILETRDVTQVPAPLLWPRRGAGSSPLGRVLGRKPRVRRDTRHDVSAVRGQRRSYLVARNLLAPGKSITH